jgi:hypothetical protein
MNADKKELCLVFIGVHRRSSAAKILFFSRGIEFRLEFGYGQTWGFPSSQRRLIPVPDRDVRLVAVPV